MKTTTLTEKSKIGSEGKSQNVIEAKLAARGAAAPAREQQSCLVIIGLHESRLDDRDEEQRCELSRAAKRRRRMVWWPGKMALIVLLMMIVVVQQPTCCSASSLADYDGATFYKAPVGSAIRIACNGSRLSTDDQSSVSLILWFKGSLAASNSDAAAAAAEPAAGQPTNSEPIYTVDARQRPLNGGARHFVADAYKGRAKFVTKSWPPYLDLAPLEADDQAEYRCRIDYRAKPRENFLIILFVLGRPAPALTWKRGTRVIDESYLTLNDYFALKQSERLWPPTSKGRDEQHPSGIASAAHDNSRSNWSSNPDNNLQQQQQQQWRHENSISANPSLSDATSAGQLRSLASEWRALAEFRYLELNESSLTASLAPSGGGTNRVGAGAAGRKLAAGSEAAAARATIDPGGQAAAQLLTLPVDESITTAVNVLRLLDLAGSGEQVQQHQPSLSGGQSLAPDNKPANKQQQQQLECLASNLHYDLRTLIKLFAPPSLLAPSSGNQPEAAAAAAADEEGASSGRQLAEAIERALESNLFSSSAEQQQQQAPTTAQQSSLPAAAGSSLLESKSWQNNNPGQEAAALKQSNLKGHKQQQEAAASWPRADDKQADVIYQQLSRPHKLASDWQRQQQTRDPLERSRLIELDIYTRPLDVRVTSAPPGQAFAAGQVAEFTCTSGGSRPAAKLSWLRNNEPLPALLWRQIDEPVQQQELNGSSAIGGLVASHSKLTLKLERQDHGARLSCRAENEHLTRLIYSSSPTASDLAEQGNFSSPLSSSSSSTQSARFLEDSRTLIVNYPPKVKLELGASIKSSSIREGTDIYFVCQVEAQPAAREITWLHNERQINPLQASPEAAETDLNDNGGASSSAQILSSAIIISNNSLVLQRAGRKQRGQYACVASNSEGLGESNRIELRVLHAPVCSRPAALGPPMGAGDGDADDDGNDRQRAAGSQRKPRPFLAANKRPSIGELEDSSSASSLLVERKRLRPGARSRFVCQMEADPSELEFSWFLNNSLGQRQPLQPLPASASVSGGGGGGKEKGPRSAASAGRQSSQLEFQPDSALDYGQIYCEARNSIGAQSRACLYEIREPQEQPSAHLVGPDSSRALNLQEDAAAIASGHCLAVNVTHRSAWIGCEPHIAASSAGSGGSEGSDGSGGGSDDSPRRLRLSAELFSQENNDRRIEANLTLDAGQADSGAPLFLAVTNLRPSCNYLVRLAGDGGIESEIQFRTSEAAGAGAAAAAELGQESLLGSGRPSIQLVGSETRHRMSHLMSTLISVRSTNSQSAAAATSGELAAGARWPRVEPSNAPGSLLLGSRLLGSLADTFSALFSRQSSLAPTASPRLLQQNLNLQQQQQPRKSSAPPTAASQNNLMDLSDTFLLTSLASLALVLMLALSLLLVRRYSNVAARRSSLCNRSSSSSLSSSSCSPGSQQIQLKSSPAAPPSSVEANCKSPEKPAPPRLARPPPSLSSSGALCHAPARDARTGCAARNSQQQRQRQRASAATATLDMRKLAAMRQTRPAKNEPTTTTTTSTCLTALLRQPVYYSASESEFAPELPTTRVTKSRSSVCLASLAANVCQAAAAGQQQLGQQPANNDHKPRRSSASVASSASASTHLTEAGSARQVAEPLQQQQQQERQICRGECRDPLEFGHFGAPLISDANSPPSLHLGQLPARSDGGGDAAGGGPAGCARVLAPAGWAAKKCQDNDERESMTGPAARLVQQSSSSGGRLVASGGGRSEPPDFSANLQYLPLLELAAAAGEPNALTNLTRRPPPPPAADQHDRYAQLRQPTSCCSAWPFEHEATASSVAMMAAHRHGQPDVTSGIPIDDDDGDGDGLHSSLLAAAFDENQVQFIELLPAGVAAATSATSINDDRFLMMQHHEEAAGEHPQYLTLGQAPNRLQLIDAAAISHSAAIARHSPSWLMAGSPDELLAAQAAGLLQNNKTTLSGARGSSLASSSLASSTLNEQPLSGSPLSSSQANTTPSNSNTTSEPHQLHHHHHHHKETKHRRIFNDSSANSMAK